MLDLHWRQEKNHTKLCRQFFQTRDYVRFRHNRQHRGGGDAYKLVLFQFVPGAFHIDILLGRETFADLKTR